MTVAEIPLFLDTTFGQSTFLQLRLSPGLRKVLFASALGTVALALAAHQLKRHKHKKKQITAGNGGLKLGGVPGSVLPVRRSSSAKKAVPFLYRDGLGVLLSETPAAHLEAANLCLTLLPTVWMVSRGIRQEGWCDVLKAFQLTGKF
ncbi:mitoguardin 2-like isoform X1 [Xenopus tropicalis]|nr:mitoguardin 2-like isoform X1 [Xenopus tropicalis]